MYKYRPRDPAKWSGIADVVSALSIPVIANGDVFEYDDFQHIKSATGFGIRGFVGDGCKRGHFGILQYFHLKAKFLMRIPKKNILGSASCGIMILEAPSIH
ncbi:uncharacterized protein [Medicago truncatula]|uniref:uncharacterized protein isoform X3 n=1 Tax=Medicago truncatula TaxID=3880 RepID=UPI000D2F3B9E|nr:uncharacterized protein LOC25500032 isoform X3 [Medicago truncatula]